MNCGSTTEQTSSRTWLILSAALLGILLVYLLWVAWRMTLDFYDGYEILLYARSIANASRYGYSSFRSPLMPALLAPWFFLERTLVLGHLAETASHLTSVLVFALLLAAFYKLLRLDLAPRWAAVGTVCLGLNPLVVHNAPSIMTDIPATLFVTLAFYWYWRGSHPAPSGRRWLVAGLFLAMAAMTRYNLIPLPVSVIVAHELVSGGFRSGSRGALAAKFGALVVWPCAFILLFLVIVFPLMQICRWWQAPARYFSDLVTIEGYFNTSPRLPSVLTYRFLVKSCTWPLAVCAIIGLMTAWKRRLTLARLHALWFVLFFLVHTYLLIWKEARYLYPLFPPLYYFVVLGLEAISRHVRQRVSGPAIRPFVSGACVALALAQPLYLAARECYRFTDPVYHNRFAERVSLAAQACADDRRIVWLGTYYPIHPAEYVFDPADSYTYVYHFSAHVLWYYSGNPVVHNYQALLLPMASGGEAVYPIPEIVGLLNDGEVLVVNREADSYNTRTLPATLKPLVVERLRILTLGTVTEERGIRTFSASSKPTAKLNLSESDGSWLVSGEGLPADTYYLFADTGGPRPQYICAVHSDGSRLAAMIPQGLFPAGADVKGLALYFFDCVNTFAVGGNR